MDKWYIKKVDNVHDAMKLLNEKRKISIINIIDDRMPAVYIASKMTSDL